MKPFAARMCIISERVVNPMERFMEAGRTDMTDEQFIRAYEMYKNTVYAVIYHYVQNDADAADVIQDSILKAYTNLSQLRNRERFRSWMLSIVHNTAIQYIRKRRGSCD